MGARAPERRYAGLAAADRRDQRRERLLDAGLETFGTAGYSGSAIEAICATANVSTRHFYEHFANREALLTAVYDRIVDEVAQGVQEASGAAPLDAEARSRAALRVFVESLLADERRGRVVLIEVVGVSPALERRRREVIRLFAAVIAADARRLIAAGAAADGDVELATIMLVGAVNELLVDCMHRPSRPPVDHLVEETTRLFAAVAHRPA